MVLGLLAITAIPTITGVGQAVSAQKKQNAAAKEQAKFYLTASVPGFREIGVCVLSDGKLLVELVENQEEECAQEPQPQLQSTKGHKFCGYYFTYPSEEQHLGLVSTIADDPPMLNWIYVNRETREVEHGGRKQTLGHVIGPWGWSRDESFLTLQGDDEGFVVREGEGGYWAVYWEPDSVESERTTHHCMPVKLRRRPLLGVNSRYVRGHEG
ncbi:hypothetical protein L249_6808 [Ophiocordyceps polyrhachis-furcata BCC 54312]|uniref:Uncharacterized protein n=1 Tax=Ophiocordyceps polyrhachis-furcata BCC 54312 TaxID=1330021 RepID=A0A367LKW9_9HYPO|nr:hypothetical protein L249_6808 [Ophiocordyceps polyrhachis-furcata BCC 54312]